MKDSKKILANIKKRLPAKYRNIGIETLHKIVNEGKTISEVAKEMKVPESFIINMIKDIKSIGKIYDLEDFA